MAEKTIKPVQDRHAGIKLLPNYVYADDAARNKDIRRDAVAAFLGTKAGGKPQEYSISTADVMKAMPPRHGTGTHPDGAQRASAPAPADQDRISRSDPSWSERIGDAAGELAVRLGGGRYDYQRANDKVRDIIDFVPGLGQMVGGNEVARAARRGDKVGAAIGTAAIAAGLFPGGKALASKALRAATKSPLAAVAEAKKLASRSVPAYDPPAKPLRDFALDYPDGGVADEAGRLQFDIDGRPLVAKHVVGRSMVGQSDRPLGYDGLVAVGTGLTREGISRVAASDLRGRAGTATFDKHLRAPIGIRLGDWLTPPQQQRVLGHEVGHVIDEVAHQIPHNGLSQELKPLYNTLNTGFERTRNLTGPQHLNYKGEEIAREYMAEAVRAYMTDPNYMKTVAPKSAARIREHVNEHPGLKDVI